MSEDRAHLWEGQTELRSVPHLHRGTGSNQCRLTHSNRCRKSLSTLMRKWLLPEASRWFVGLPNPFISPYFSGKNVSSIRTSVHNRRPGEKFKAYQSRGARLCWLAESCVYFSTMQVYKIGHDLTQVTQVSTDSKSGRGIPRQGAHRRERCSEVQRCGQGKAEGTRG